MKYINDVDVEGGPLLIADATTAQGWHGVEEGSIDYDRACKVTDIQSGGKLMVNREDAMVWHIGGPGMVDVFADEKRILIVRAWLDTQGGMAEITALAELPLNDGTQIGALSITSGVLTILWAAESGKCIETLDIDQQARPTGEMAFDSSGLLIKVPNGHYLLLHDEVEIKDDSALRCHIVPEDQMTSQ